QYLTFTSRVEINRHATTHPVLRVAAYYAILAGSAWIVFKGILTFGAWSGAAMPMVNLVGLTWVNIVTMHHYFVDGCIWKLSNPEVRRDLFLHLPAGKALHPVAKRQAATA